MSSSRPHVPGLAIAVLLVLLVGAALAVSAGASDPTQGTVSVDSPTTAWQGKHYDVGQTKVADLCAIPSDELCDSFDLTVDIPASHWESNDGGVEVKIAWQDESDDFDLYVYDADGNLVGESAVGGTTSERVFIDDASGTYRVSVSPWGVTDSSYMGGAHVESRADVGQTGGEVPSEPLSGVPCVDGAAGPFPCKGIDLESFLPRDEIGGGELNDIWGWTDPQTGREYALIGKTSGTAFVDVTDARKPVYLGDLPSHQPVETIFNVWRDVKVYKNHAFVVAEEPAHGMQVFDLTRLRGKTSAQTWTEDAHYSFAVDGIQSFLEVDPTRATGPDNAHNIAINEDSGFAYAIGTSTCGGGPHMIDIRDPKAPKFAGCVSEDGYTHDTQCVSYRAGDPDPAFAGREICFNSNEDTLTVVDVTDKDDPEQLARVPYDGATYTHQAWLTEDRKQILVDDELDETERGGGTKTYVFNVERLRSPRYLGTYQSEAEAIDHNQYVKGERTYQSNYRAGLRVLDLGGVGSGRLTEAGFFDVYPADDKAEFNGTWSNYPYFKSGVVIVSGIEQGLFVVRPDRRTAGAPPESSGSPPAPPARTPGQPSGQAADRTRPTPRLAGVPRSIRYSKLRRRGLKPRVSSSEPVALRFQLLRRKVGRRGFKATMARKSLRLADGPRTTRLKPSRRKLGRRRSFTAKLRVTAIDAAGNRRVVARYVRVRR